MHASFELSSEKGSVGLQAVLASISVPAAAGADQMALEDVSVVPIPADGNCLFASLSVAFLLAQKKMSLATALRDADEVARVGRQCRKEFLKNMRSKLDDPQADLGGVRLDAALEASTGMSKEAYLQAMTLPDAMDKATWGGFFEIAALAWTWRFYIHVYEKKAEHYQLLTSVGRASGHAHKASPLLIAWVGKSHYEVLLRSAGAGA